ncbi:MAG: cytochrome c, partial [Melioribacteraceae bacterium]|nr:cytochrome c [Melioribacteraceae bacterium]
KNTTPANYTDSLDINVNVDVKKGGILPAIDLSIISSPDNQLLENGNSLYNTNCASCHGNEGRGDGVAAVALNPPPRNFYDGEGWKNGRDFNAIYKTLQEGIAGGGMIAYDFLSIEDRIAIIHYIRTMTDFPEITEETVAELDQTWNLSEGVISPNNITLEMAVEKITSESSRSNEEVSQILDNITSSSNKVALELFNEVVHDKEMAIRIFMRDFSDESDRDAFVSRIVAFPKESGFKSKVSLLSQNELSELYNLLNRSVG